MRSSYVQLIEALRLVTVITALSLSGCIGGDSVPFNDSASTTVSSQHLYVVSGPCYGGGVTTSTGPSNTVSRYNLRTGAFEKIVIDYNQLAPGDSPVAIHNYDADHLLVLVENASGRRIDLVSKSGLGASNYLVNATALSATLRSFVFLSDFSLLVSKSSAIEKFSSGKSRVLSGAAAYVNAPAGSCATSTTLITSVIASPTGKIIYTHAALTPNNKIGVIKTSGYAVPADCLSGTAAPTTTALPTRALLHSSGKLLVAYGSTTAASNLIYAYDYDDSAGVVSNPVEAYNDAGTILNGPSAMAEDPETGDVFVANVNSTYNTIERFNFSGTTMTRAAGATFIPYSANSRCVADMKVMQ